MPHSITTTSWQKWKCALKQTQKYQRKFFVWVFCLFSLLVLFPMSLYWSQVSHANTDKCIYSCWNISSFGQSLKPYHIAETFEGENFHHLAEIRFSQRKLLQIARWCRCQKIPRSRISRKKLPEIATKPWNSQKNFSPGRFSLYSIL